MGRSGLIGKQTEEGEKEKDEKKKECIGWSSDEAVRGDSPLRRQDAPRTSYSKPNVIPGLIGLVSAR